MTLLDLCEKLLVKDAAVDPETSHFLQVVRAASTTLGKYRR